METSFEFVDNTNLKGDIVSLIRREESVTSSTAPIYSHGVSRLLMSVTFEAYLHIAVPYLTT